jgi:hypothetical protein
MSPAFGSSFISLRDMPDALGTGDAISRHDWVHDRRVLDRTGGVSCAAK